MDIAIRPAILADDQKIHEIYSEAVRELCRQNYTSSQTAAWLSGRKPAGYHRDINAGEVFVAHQQGQIIGFGHALTGVIEGIFVDPDFVGTGVGGQLLEHGLEMAKGEGVTEIRLDSSLNTQQFYKRYGFIPQETITYSINGEELPFIIMTLPIDNVPINSRPIKGLGEIAFRVEDLSAMQAFYEDVVGLELLRRFPSSAFFKIAPGYAGHTQILALFDRQGSDDYQPISPNHTTVDHIAFTIALADFESELARLRELGLKVYLSTHGWVQWRSLYISDPEGNLVEWVCHDPAIPRE